MARAESSGMIVDAEGRNVTPDWETVHVNTVWSVWLTERGTLFVHGCTGSGDDDEAEHAVELDGLTCSLDDDRWDEIYGRHPYVWGSNEFGQLGTGDCLGRRWPAMVEGYSVVHPDRTLRRSKRTVPFTRRVVSELPAEETGWTGGNFLQ